MIRPLLTLAAALVTLPASAQVPNFDTTRRCAEFAKSNYTVENDCRRNEAEARRELERSRISQEVWAACKEQVQTEQSYVLLYGCTLNEAETKANQRRAAPIPVGPMNIPAMDAPTLNTGAGSRPAPPSTRPGSITVMRGSATTIENPGR
jgi:hypothetical protein